MKSTAKIDLTIVEEAEDVPEASWLALEATVFRQPKRSCGRSGIRALMAPSRSAIR